MDELYFSADGGFRAKEREMGVGFAVFLLDDETRLWIQQEGIAVPELGAPSRWPTPKELRSALESLKGYSVTYRANTGGGWDAEVVDDAQGHEVQSATIWTKSIRSGLCSLTERLG